MKTLNIAINGLGRIGKNFLHTIIGDKEASKHLKIRAINIGHGTFEAVPYLIKYDTLLGRFKGHVELKDDLLIIDGQEIYLLAEPDVKKIDWKRYNIDWVVDATGQFTHAKDARLHIESGAKKVLITAPAKNEDCTIIPGVNYEAYKPEDTIISLGSCTTNAVVPMLDILDRHFGIQNAFFTTVHAYTNSQALLDGERRDLRESRAAVLNIIPTSTGANKVATKVLPQLEGKVKGTSMRVPVAKVSLLDLACVLEKDISSEAINAAFLQESEQRLKGIVSITTQELVSSDFYHNDHSVIIDSQLTLSNKNLCKVFGWYDNEWGYSKRLTDFLVYTLK